MYILVLCVYVRWPRVDVTAGGKEAEKLARALPFGRGFVCSDTSRLPGALKDMFTAVSMERSLEWYFQTKKEREVCRFCEFQNWK